MSSERPEAPTDEPETPAAAGEGGGEPAAAATEAAEAGQPAAEAATTSVSVEELEALRRELEVSRRELEETTRSLKRTQADFANYRKRMLAEQSRWEERAVAHFVRELLPVLDNLERAIEAFDRHDQASGALKEGVALTLRQFREILGRRGIEPIDSVGRPFDPRLHEAMMQVETDAVPEHYVVAELQRGYRWGDEILRPALVQVAKAPQAEAAPPADAEGAGPAKAQVGGEQQEGPSDGQSCGH
ncbi:MAG TPA: nucleotide exchange factor GrpE [Bacillota bacterium]